MSDAGKIIGDILGLVFAVWLANAALGQSTPPVLVLDDGSVYVPEDSLHFGDDGHLIINPEWVAENPHVIPLPSMDLGVTYVCPETFCPLIWVDDPPDGFRTFKPGGLIEARNGGARFEFRFWEHGKITITVPPDVRMGWDKDTRHIVLKPPPRDGGSPVW